MKILFLISIFFFTSCSSTSTISINSETVLNDGEKVDWAITLQDSIVDFRNRGNGYAEVSGDQIVFRNSEDLINAYNINEFRSIHSFKEAPISIMILSSVVVSLAIIGYWLSGIKIG